LLLDEPMAGLGAQESRAMLELLASLRGSVTMLLVEHDLEAVFALAERVTVLEFGRVIASADAASVRADAAVQRAYLGTEFG
jgi:branched-chain amino acid transport system ATP-binding protein